MNAIYTAEALATGAGRDGHVRSADGLVDMDLAIPKEMGGQGGARVSDGLCVGIHPA